MNFETLAVAASANPTDAIKYADWLDAAMERFMINKTKKRKAMFIAQCAIESSYLAKVEEGLYYKDAQYLANTYPSEFGRSAARAQPYTRNPQGFSQLRYQGFHGRGLIQLTWKENYQAASLYFGIDFVAQPDLLLQPEFAALTAAWYFTVFRPCLELSDQDDVVEVTRKINGNALMHLDKRQAQYDIALSVDL